MATMRLSMLRPQVGLLNQQHLATRIVFNQLPKAAVTSAIRSYATNQGKQILLRDHGVFGEFFFIKFTKMLI